MQSHAEILRDISDIDTWALATIHKVESLRDLADQHYEMSAVLIAVLNYNGMLEFNQEEYQWALEFLAESGEEQDKKIDIVIDVTDEQDDESNFTVVLRMKDDDATA